MRRKLILNSSTVFIFTWNIFASINLHSIAIFYLIHWRFLKRLQWSPSKVEFYFCLEIRKLLIICDQIAFFSILLKYIVSQFGDILGDTLSYTLIFWFATKLSFIR